MVGLPLFLVASAFAQAPGLLWTTDIGATLFAVDAQTNVYANVGTNVIKLSPSGLVISTNSICPKPGVARMDAAGNYYFAGNFDGTQNFGGIILVGGWTNSPSGGWTAGYPTHFVAKYNSSGVQQWVKAFGQQASSVNLLSDLLVDSTGGVFVGHLGMGSFSGAPTFTRLDNNGNILWSRVTSSAGGRTAVKLGGLTSTNFCFLEYGIAGIAAARLDFLGNNSGFSTAVFFPMQNISGAVANGTPVLDNLDRILVAGKTNGGQQVLCKFAPSGSLVWAQGANHGEQWSLARDAGECFYFGSISNVLIKYDANGTALWQTNYQRLAVNMIVDGSGNRFLGFADGSIARLAADETPQPPLVLVPPQNQIASLGSNVTFFTTISGSPTMYYQWRKDGTNLVGATATNYTIASVTTNHVGSYDVVATNAYGSVTSTPPASLSISPSLLSPYVGVVGLWGQQATLSVSAYGSGTLAYQWYKAGQAISGATNNTLLFPTLQISDAGLYSVVVASQYGIVTNTPAQLVVNPANISLGLYAGILIEGTAGYTYGIEYTTNLQSATWQSLTNITLGQPVEVWVDKSIKATDSPKRYYRVTNQ